MSFPTTPVLDTFNRANGAPGANWAQTFGISTMIAISSNQATSAAAGAGASYWVTTLFSQDHESWMIINTLPGGATNCYVQIALTEPTSGSLYDIVEFRWRADTGAWDIYASINASGTTIVSGTSATLAAGSIMGLRQVRDRFEAWHKPSAGTWLMLGAATDTRYRESGYIDCQLMNNTIRVDDFAGGAVNRRLCALGAGI